jgi:hypothetical protein
MNTFSVEDWTRMYNRLERTQSRFEPSDSDFEKELPSEIRAELETARQAPNARGPTPARFAFRSYLRPSVPAPPPIVTPPTAQPPPRRGTAIWWWWLAAIAGVATIVGISLAINQLPKQVIFSPPIDPAPSPPALEVRRALPVIEVRRALPAVPRALPVSSATTTVPTVGWQSIRMLDGRIVPVHYEGELPSSAALPPQGRFLGEEWSSGKTSWIWMTPAGASFPSWVDP